MLNFLLILLCKLQIIQKYRKKEIVQKIYKETEREKREKREKKKWYEMDTKIENKKKLN